MKSQSFRFCMCLLAIIGNASLTAAKNPENASVNASNAFLENLNFHVKPIAITKMAPVSANPSVTAAEDFTSAQSILVCSTPARDGKVSTLSLSGPVMISDQEKRDENGWLSREARAKISISLIMGLADLGALGELAGRVERYEDTIEMKGHYSRLPGTPTINMTLSPVQERKDGHFLNSIYAHLNPADPNSQVWFYLQIDDNSGNKNRILIRSFLSCNLKSH